MRRATNPRWAAGALAILATLILSGCMAGKAGTISSKSLTCQSAQSLFAERDAVSGNHLDRLVSRVPEDLRATVEALRNYPSSDEEWIAFQANLADVQDWAVSACGVSVAFPADAGNEKPRLKDFLATASRDGELISVLVSGATGLDSAVVLCEQALEEYAEPGHSITLEVKDSLGIMLATLDDAGECVVGPEFAP